jgi:hypothetical protein
MHSDALRCTQMHSDALRCNQSHLWNRRGQLEPAQPIRSWPMPPTPDHVAHDVEHLLPRLLHTYVAPGPARLRRPSLRIKRRLERRLGLQVTLQQRRARHSAPEEFLHLGTRRVEAVTAVTGLASPSAPRFGASAGGAQHDAGRPSRARP